MNHSSNPSRSIVLVHGAWVGEWSWNPLLPYFEGDGRRVEAVSLRGHGKRAAESSPNVTLEDHVSDVVQLIDAERLSNITLVGHSYGGRVITGVWAKRPDSIAAMVYVDAHAPLIPQTNVRAAEMYRAAHEEATDGMIVMNRFHPDPELVKTRHLTKAFASVMPQSARTFDHIIDVPPLPPSLQKAYVFCGAEKDHRFAEYAQVASQRSDWRVITLDSDHWPMLSCPAELASIICSAHNA